MFHANLPRSQPPEVVSCSLFQKCAHLLHLTAARGSIIEEIAELAGIWLHVHRALDRPGVAVEDHDLVLRAAFLA